MVASVSLRGKRRLFSPNPSSLRTRPIISAASAASITVNRSGTPTARPCLRNKRLPTEWNVPPQTCAASRRPLTPSARRNISRAARRVKVSSRIRSGGTPLFRRWATRHTRVLVFPLPAPATTRRERPSKTTASRWRSLSSARGKVSNIRSHAKGCVAPGGGRAGGRRPEPGELLLRGLEVGIRAGGVVGHVDHLGDLRHRVLEGHLDPLPEGDGRHAAPLAAAAQSQICGAALNRHQVGPAPVRRDRRVDVPVQYLLYALGDVAGEISRPPCSYRRTPRSHRRTGAVGVVDH